MIAKLEDAGCEESVVGLVIPTGYSFNLDGTCLYLATAAVFLEQATNTPLSIEQQLGLLAVLLLASKGAAGVAGAAFVVLAATLASVGTIPVESVALILGVHRLMSEGLTPTNLIGNGVATLVIANGRTPWTSGGFNKSSTARSTLRCWRNPSSYEASPTPCAILLLRGPEPPRSAFLNRSFPAVACGQRRAECRTRLARAGVNGGCPLPRQSAGACARPSCRCKRAC